jgi:hypothetical protein
MNDDMVKIPKDTGGPAFAKPGVQGRCVEDNEPGHDGMTLRDYFAAAALTGIEASDSPDYNLDADGAARRAYGRADAMLRVRRETKYDLVPRLPMSDDES